MASEERKSLRMGYGLCQSCSKLIDTDTKRYSKPVLLSWKRIAEEYAVLELETASPVQTVAQDKEIIKFYVHALIDLHSRPICQEGRMEDFDKAIEDTIIALNTGVLRTRDGEVLKQSEGKSVIQNPVWREKLDAIADMLVSIRRRLKIAKEEKGYTAYGSNGDVFYCFSDRELGEWFNLTAMKS
jgi:hypothetical protein